MNIEQIKNIPPKTLNVIMASQGMKALDVSPELAIYAYQVKRGYDIFTSDESDGTIIGAATKLQKEFPTISLATARRRISDGISLVHSEMDTTAETWYELYADKMDRLGKLCEKNGELEAARRSYEIALDYHVKAAAGRVDPERTKFKRMLVSPDVQGERLGLGSTGVRELLRKSKQIIEQSTLSPKDRERVLEDLELEVGVEDIEYEEA